MTIQRLALLCLFASLVVGSAARADDENLADLDLATLMTMDVTITSAAKHAQASSDAAAAVYVITREDIRRSGAAGLPELLRMVPGLQVGRVSTRSWSVSARGSSSRFANKLLVMIDGRSIYTAIFSGVIWEEQPILLDNIERIEVVRGPGGALWGINAVNGVINIITRNAADAPGALLSVDAGSVEERAALRYAGRVERLGDYRVYVGGSAADALDDKDTDVEQWQAGWRVDRTAFGGEMTFEAEITDSDFSEYDGLPDSAYHRFANGGAAILDWRRTLALGSVELRGVYSTVERSQPGAWDEFVLGVDAQFSAHRAGRHLLTTGLGYRRVVDEQRGFIPALRLAQLECAHDQWSVYAQDELHFREDAARLILGAKLEHFEFTGFAFQPTVRGIWKATPTHTLWSAVSRALRAPSRFEMHSMVESRVQDQPFPIIVRMTGDAALEPEELIAYELGWRWRPHETVAFDLALYQNEYESLIGAFELGPVMQPGPAPFLLLPIVYANSIDARTRGAELSAEWQPSPYLRLQAGVALFDVSASANGGNLTSAVAGGNIDPEESYSLRAQVDPLDDVELDIAWRYVSALRGLDVDSYDALEVRAAWRPLETFELSLAVKNLLGGSHREFRDEQAGQESVVIERTWLARFTWRPNR